MRFDAYADPDPSNSFTYLGKSEIILLLFTAVPVFTLVYLSHQRQRSHNFLYFEQYVENFWKKYNLALHLVEMNADPDPPKLFRSDRIRIHYYILGPLRETIVTY